MCTLGVIFKIYLVSMSLHRGLVSNDLLEPNKHQTNDHESVAHSQLTIIPNFRSNFNWSNCGNCSSA